MIYSREQLLDQRNSNATFYDDMKELLKKHGMILSYMDMKQEPYFVQVGQGQRFNVPSMSNTEISIRCYPNSKPPKVVAKPYWKQRVFFDMKYHRKSKDQ